MEKNEKLIYITGAMRSGTNLFYNILGVHSNVLVMGEIIFFFRFFYERYGVLSRETTIKMLQEQNARIYYRFGLKYDVDEVMKEVDKYGCEYKNVYQSIVKFFLEKSAKSIFGDGSPVAWREIEKYLNLFPQAKIVHIYRDPRAVLSSWHNHTFDKPNSWCALFNCIDSMNYIMNLQTKLPDSCYKSIKYEDIINMPELTVKDLCNFLEIEYDPGMISPKKWPTLFKNNKLHIRKDFSSHANFNPDCFDKSRISNWKNNIENWQLCVCEWMCKEHLEAFGYELISDAFNSSDICKGIDALRQSPWTFQAFKRWLETSEGTQGHTVDPSLPENWFVPGKSGERFLNTEHGKMYLKELAKIRDE